MPKPAPARDAGNAPFALAVALGGLALFCLDVAAARHGLVARAPAAIGGMALLALTGLCAILLSAGRLIRGPGGKGTVHAVAALVVALPMLGFPLFFLYQGLTHPAIYDISTDLKDPPAFVALLAVRAAVDANPLDRSPRETAKQAAGYPDVHGLTLGLPPAASFARALATARAMGWRIAAADAASGHIEATATTRLFGFSDDIVVRIRAAPGGGSRIDLRSVSRRGNGDFGANAARIRAYLSRLRQP